MAHHSTEPVRGEIGDHVSPLLTFRNPLRCATLDAGSGVALPFVGVFRR